MTPGTRHSGSFAEQVMEQDVGSPGCVWRSKVAYDAIETEQGLGEIAFEMTVKNVTRRTGRIFVNGADFRGRKPTRSRPRLSIVGRPRTPPPDCGGDFKIHFRISGTTVSSSAM